MKDLFKIAVLDLYDGEPNQGMRCIQNILKTFEAKAVTQVFDVRGKAEVPNLDFDIYICSGGPGNPLDGDGVWDRQFYKLIQQLWNWNFDNTRSKKYVFFICHSFQMAGRFFEIGEITPRRSKSFGVFPVHKTDEGKSEKLFEGLPNPFYAADFRDFQIVSPNEERLKELGAEILALEKIRPHVDLERAVMAIRFSDEFVGVQFHPEANAEGMLIHFSNPLRKKAVIEKYGEEKYYQIIRDLENPLKVNLTYNTILPKFLSNAMEELQKEVTVFE